MTAPKPRDMHSAQPTERPALAFASRITRTVSTAVPYSDAVTLSAVQQQTIWAHLHAGLDLDPSVVFRRDVIALGVEQLPMRSEASLGRRRAVLTRVGEALGVLELPRVPYAGSIASTPYSDGDIMHLRGWASTQRLSVSASAHCLLALGLGTGLLPREICAVRSRDVDSRNGRLCIQLPRGFVFVTDAWAPTLIALAGAAADRDAPLFLPHVRIYKNKIGDFTRKSIGTRQPPVPLRMRATWIVERMAEGLPVQDLLHQTGVGSLDALARFERHLSLSALRDV